MSKNGTWGDHLVLLAAANYYRTDIRVISSLGREVFISPDRPVVNTSPLVLGHVHEDHSVSLHPKKGKPLFLFFSTLQAISFDARALKQNFEKLVNYLIVWLNWSALKSSFLLGSLSRPNSPILTLKMDCSRTDLTKLCFGKILEERTVLYEVETLLTSAKMTL